MAAWTYTIGDGYYYSHMTLVDNANNIKDYLTNEGFSDAAIIGIIANMEHESYLNPAQQEHGKGGSASFGYGLVQWTPARTKILEYANRLGVNWYDGDIQMDYLMINAPQSWIEKNQYPYSWEEYKSITDFNLATETFFYNFERGTWHNDLYTYTNYWADVLYGQTPPIPPDPPTPPTPPDPPDPSVEEDLLYLALKMTKVLK